MDCLIDSSSLSSDDGLRVELGYMFLTNGHSCQDLAAGLKIQNTVFLIYCYTDDRKGKGSCLRMREFCKLDRSRPQFLQSSLVAEHVDYHWHLRCKAFDALLMVEQNKRYVDYLHLGQSLLGYGPAFPASLRYLPQRIERRWGLDPLLPKQRLA